MTNIQEAVKRVLDIIGEPTFENIERFLLEQYDCPIVYIGSDECNELDKLYSFGDFLEGEGFVTLRDKYYLFLNPKTEAFRRLMELYHELGHIECKHLEYEQRLPRVIEEQEAEAFAYHLRCDAEERVEIYLEQNIGVVAMPLMQEV